MLNQIPQGGTRRDAKRALKGCPIQWRAWVEEGVLGVSPALEPLLLQRLGPGHDQRRQILFKILVQLEAFLFRELIKAWIPLIR